ncbi:GNAT family N-acetyltransferase [Maritimibacter fusiformis]|uniref:GNAT family N-acetyltransferase n=1 Tax=Maritimibacter fusiformis TaxID=2603819 RepID=UPI0016523E4E|nr:GNAT family N-acetyltransferase [Maritimibacter fusiformis]
MAPPPVTLRTRRLRLRPLVRADVPALVAALDDYDVSKWLTVVPYPYGEADALAFLDHQKGAAPLAALGIFDDQGFAGVIGAADGLGYWLGRAHHGKGYMREAAAAVVARFFASSDAAALTSGYFEGNAASARVLAGLGFVADGQDRVMSRAQRAEVVLNRVILHRAEWQARHAG